MYFIIYHRVVLLDVLYHFCQYKIQEINYKINLTFTNNFRLKDMKNELMVLQKEKQQLEAERDKVQDVIKKKDAQMNGQSVR